MKRPYAALRIVLKPGLFETRKKPMRLLRLSRASATGR
jgi:hypothetical protein